MSDDPFAELEKQLAEIAAYGSKKTTTPTSTRTSVRLDNSQNLLSPNNARTSPNSLSPTTPSATISPPSSLQGTEILLRLYRHYF
jgi:hypothetical protein